MDVTAHAYCLRPVVEPERVYSDFLTLLATLDDCASTSTKTPLGMIQSLNRREPLLQENIAQIALL